MTPQVFNAPLADRVLGHIKANPASHDQNHYIARNECGTVACVAGWTVILEDGLTEWSVDWMGPRFDGLDIGIAYADRTGRREHIADRARNLLGITEAQALELFASTRTLPEIETLLKQYANEATP